MNAFYWKRHFNECCGHKALSRGNNSNYSIASHGHRQKHLDPIKFRQSKLPIEIFYWMNLIIILKKSSQNFIFKKC